MSQVYRRRLQSVNLVLTAALLGFVVNGTGCAVVPKAEAGPFLVSVRYDVEPMFTAMAPDQAVAAIRSDFQEIARLGFNAVLLKHVFLGDVPSIVGMAHESALNAVLADQRSDQYVVYPPHRRGFYPVATSGPASIGYVDTSPRSEVEDYSPTQRWLDGFHRGLRGGGTGGIVLDRYRRLPGDPPGLADAGAPHASARRAALSELRERARRWGDLIMGMEVQNAAPAEPERDVTMTLLYDRRRRFLLLYNPLEKEFVRCSTTLPEQMAGAPVRRAVEVPSSGAKPVGLVVTRSSAGVILPISLRPGDAVLYEIF